MQLGVGFRHDLDDAAILDRGIALQPQGGEEYVVHQGARDRPRRDDVDRALDARVEHEVLAAELAHGLHHALDIGVDEVERDGVGPRRLGPARRAEQAQHQRSHEFHLAFFSGQASVSRVPFRSRTT